MMVGWIMDKPGIEVVAEDHELTVLRLELEGSPTITLTLKEARRLITLALTIPDLTMRIEIIEKARGTSHGR